MEDPFAIQISSNDRPVHGRPGRFLFKSRRGHNLEDYTVSEDRTPYLGVSADKRMFRVFFVILSIVFVCFLARAMYLQILQGSYYREVAEGNRIRLEDIPALRGLIFDKNGLALVQNTPQFVLVVRPIDFPRDEVVREGIFKKLEQYDISRDLILAALNEHPRSMELIPIKKSLTHESAVQFISLLNGSPGINIQIQTQRQYVSDRVSSLSHLLGYVGYPSTKDLSFQKSISPARVLGKTGLEASYEEKLSGLDGRKRIEIDAFGNEKEIIVQENSQNGTHLVLNLDLALQFKVEEILQKNLLVARKTRGAVVVLDPRDGGVLTLTSFPSFDSNEFEKGLSEERYQKLINDPDRPLFPRAIAGAYPSGSTIKPIFAAGALEDEIITPQTTIVSTGGISIGQWFFPDWRTGGHGPTNVYHAIADSVNTFFYYIGGGYGDFKGLGPERLVFWAKRFGLGTTSGLDLPGEATGFVPTRDWKERERGEEWYIGDTYHFTIGQGDVLVTPLQMANAIATIANGGTLYEPQLVNFYRDSEGNEELILPVVRDKDFISSESLKVTREAMRQTITTGSAQRMSILPVAVAGKTGTAEWSSTKPPHSWFVGFAPYKNPEVAIAVLVESGGESVSTAVPIAQEILAWYFTNRDQSN